MLYYAKKKVLAPENIPIDPIFLNIFLGQLNTTFKNVTYNCSYSFNLSWVS